MLTHWKKLTNPNYLGSYAFEPGEEKVGTIARVGREIVTGQDGKQEDCIVAHFQEPDLKPLILNATNCKAIAKLYKTSFIEEWPGKRIIMRVQAVKAFGETVDAVRIKPAIPPARKNDLLCADCKALIVGYGEMPAAQVAEYTRQKYGRQLCATCAGKMKAATDEAPNSREEEDN